MLPYPESEREIVLAKKSPNSWKAIVVEARESVEKWRKSQIPRVVVSTESSPATPECGHSTPGFRKNKKNVTNQEFRRKCQRTMPLRRALATASDLE